MRLLLLAAALAAPFLPAFGQNNNAPTPTAADFLRQDAIVKAHKSDLNTINAILGIIDAAVLCHIKDAKWGMTYRLIVLRTFDQFIHEIGVSNEEMIYALRLDMERNANQVAKSQDCGKMAGKMVDDLTTTLNGMR